MSDVKRRLGWRIDRVSTFGVNTLSHFWILKEFLPAMIKAGKGHIVRGQP